MHLTRHGDYAVRVVVDLASRPAGAIVPRARIQERQGVPPAYLAKIVQGLARGGLVRTHPGARGGVSLARAASAISLRDVIEAAEGPLALNRCVVAAGACPRDRSCTVHPIWVRLQLLLARELGAVSVAELAAVPRGPEEEPVRLCS